MVITILTAVSTGGADIVSQYLGNKNYLKANLSSSQLITVSFTISLFVMILSLVLHKEILRLFFNSVENDVMKAADTYLLITGCSFPFLGIYDSSAAIYHSMEKNKYNYVYIFSYEYNKCRWEFCWYFYTSCWSYKKRELSGEFISPKDPDFHYILDIINNVFVLTTELNKLNYNNPRVREILKELFNKGFDSTSILIPPFYTDFGRNITIGKNAIMVAGSIVTKDVAPNTVVEG